MSTTFSIDWNFIRETTWQNHRRHDLLSIHCVCSFICLLNNKLYSALNNSVTCNSNRFSSIPGRETTSLSSNDSELIFAHVVRKKDQFFQFIQAEINWIQTEALQTWWSKYTIYLPEWPLDRWNTLARRSRTIEQSNFSKNKQSFCFGNKKLI